MYPLELRVNLAGWNLFVKRKQDPAFLPIQKKIFQRDHDTCQYCGFQAQQYQDVVNLDGDYRNNKNTNMITACVFCSQCLFLQSAGMDNNGGGQLIHMPEMSQADLNSFCHVLFCAMDNNTGYQDSAQSIYRSFKFRSQPIENQFGTGSSDPATLGQLMIEYRSVNPKIPLDFLKDMRLLPSYTKFKMQLEAWTEAALAEMSEES